VLLHLVHARERARAHRTLEVARTVNVVVVAEVGDRLEAHQTLPLARLQFDEHAVDHVRTWHTAACCKNQTRRVSMTADSLLQDSRPAPPEGYKTPPRVTNSRRKDE